MKTHYSHISLDGLEEKWQLTVLFVLRTYLFIESWNNLYSLMVNNLTELKPYATDPFDDVSKEMRLFS